MRASADPAAERRAGLPPRSEPGGCTMTSRCFAVLAVAGLATGVLSGLFGVGGGFVDRPGPGALHRHGHPPGRRHLAAGHRPGQRLGRGLVPRRRPAAAAGADAAVRRSAGSAGMELGTLLGRRLGGPGAAEGLRRRRSSPSRRSSCQEPRLKQRSVTMFFHQRFIPGLAIYSYMVGDEKAKQVRRHRPDPRRGRVPRHRQAGGAADHARPGDARPRRLRQRLGRAEGPARRRGAGRRLRHGRRGVDAAVRRPRGRATATRSPSAASG